MAQLFSFVLSWVALPLCRFIRRGRAQKQDDPDFDVASDIEDEELATWLEKPDLTSTLQLLQSSDSKKMTKFLPPGTVMDLFQQYASTRDLLDCPKVGYKTFMKIYREGWRDVLRFREKTLPLRLTVTHNRIRHDFRVESG